MSLSNASVLSGATMAPSGGSAITFSSSGISNGANMIYCTSDTDLRTRRTMVASVKDPKPSTGAPNNSTQARATIVFKSPLELDNGNVTVNTVRVEVAYDPETTSAELDELLVIGSQILNDSDFTAVFKNLSLA